MRKWPQIRFSNNATFTGYLRPYSQFALYHLVMYPNGHLGPRIDLRRMAVPGKRGQFDIDLRLDVQREVWRETTRIDLSGRYDVKIVWKKEQ